MPRVTKKQALIASKKFKSKRRYKSKLETLLKDINNNPAFIEIICDALILSYEMLSSQRSRNAEIEKDILSYLIRRFEELKCI